MKRQDCRISPMQCAVFRCFLLSPARCPSSLRHLSPSMRACRCPTFEGVALQRSGLCRSQTLLIRPERSWNRFVTPLARRALQGTAANIRDSFLRCPLRMRRALSEPRTKSGDRRSCPLPQPSDWRIFSLHVDSRVVIGGISVLPRASNV